MKNKFLIAILVFAFCTLAATQAFAGPQITVVSKTFIASHDWDDGIEVIPEATLTYRIVFRNSGDAIAKDPVVTDAIPQNTTFILKSLKSSFNGEKQYLDRTTQKWVKDEPKNPNRVGKVQCRYKGNIPANSGEYWVEYSVKVNY